MKKLVLIVMKIVPVVGVVCCACNSLLSYFNIDLTFLGYVMQATFLIAWYVLAIYFRFCIYYRLLVAYILTAEIINTIDYVKPLPIGNWDFFVLHCGIIGLFIIIATYIHVKNTRRIKVPSFEDS